jgi:hypothetical protein
MTSHARDDGVQGAGLHLLCALSADEEAGYERTSAPRTCAMLSL